MATSNMSQQAQLGLGVASLLKIILKKKIHLKFQKIHFRIETANISIRCSNGWSFFLSFYLSLNFISFLKKSVLSSLRAGPWTVRR